MLSGRITRGLIRVLDRIAAKTDPKENIPTHLLIGRRGEDDAYFYCDAKDMSLSREITGARHRGEIDLIGWEKDTLYFIEVKTRTTRDVKPTEAAVDRKKRHDLRIVIGDYLRTLPRRQFPEAPGWRFDVITVYYEKEPRDSETVSHPVGPKQGATRAGQSLQYLRSRPPTFELFQNVALSS